MKQNLFHIVFLFCISPFLLNGQQSTYVIGGIEFQGLKKTKESFLQDALTLKKGSSITEEELLFEVQKLKNVHGIGNAIASTDTIDNRILITYDIQEYRTLLPILNLGGIKDNLWFQLGFTDSNWRGKGQDFSAYYQNNDGFHTGQIYFRAPRVNGSEWGYSARITKWTSLEPLYFDGLGVNYRYENNGIALSGIKYFGDHNSLEIGGNYFIEKYAKSEQQNSENTPGPNALIQPKFLSKVEFSQNHLNYDFFYRSGYTWNLTYQNVINSIDNSLFNSLQFQGIGYLRPHQKTNLAFRLKLAISSNNNTPFAPFVADSHVNLRGVGNRIDRGTAQAVLNVELRQSLFTINRWSSQLVGFSDLGTWRNPGGDLVDLFNSDQFRFFMGAGFRMIYQKVFNAVIRIDYGVDVFNPSQRGFVVGLGQYF